MILTIVKFFLMAVGGLVTFVAILTLIFGNKTKVKDDDCFTHIAGED